MAQLIVVITDMNISSIEIPKNNLLRSPTKTSNYLPPHPYFYWTTQLTKRCDSLRFSRFNLSYPIIQKSGSIDDPIQITIEQGFGSRDLVRMSGSEIVGIAKFGASNLKSNWPYMVYCSHLTCIICWLD